MPDELDIDIPLPGDWVVVANEAFADRAQVEDLVGSRLDEVPELAPYRDDLIASVSNSAAHVEKEGVLLTAVLAELTPDGRARTANLAIATAPLPAQREPAAAPADAPAGAADEPVSPLRELERTLTELPSEDHVSHRRVDSVLLPGGPAVRIARLLDLPLVENGPLLGVLSVQYFFRVPDAEQIVVLSFTTPSLGELPYLQGVFHAIASGFEMRV